MVATRLNTAALTAHDEAPPLLQQLIARPTRRFIEQTNTAASMSGLRSRLHGLTSEQRHAELTDLICGSAAAVLGHNTSDIAPDRAFQDLGFDSLTAVELRNRLKTGTGLTLSPTLIFDHPTPAALAEHLDALLAAAPVPDQPDPLARFDHIARELQALVDQPGLKPEDRAQLRARIGAMLNTLETPEPAPDPADTTFYDDGFNDDLATATDSELFAILEEE